MLKNYFCAGIALLTLGFIGCNNSGNKNNQKSNDNQSNEVVYQAHLQSLNADATHSETTGDARFVISNDTMTVTIDVKGSPANIEHWQHFHGFTDGQAADVPTMEADKNGDGIIDVVETEAISGTTMVPFNADPAGMQVGSDTYPKADADGNYHYSEKIPMEKLRAAFAKAFGDSSLQLDKRVLYIHGVPSDSKLPASVASIADIPAQVTIPVAAGKIEKVSE